MSLQHEELTGLLESAYRRCLVHELQLRGVPVASEVTLDLEYKGLTVPARTRSAVKPERRRKPPMIIGSSLVTRRDLGGP